MEVRNQEMSGIVGRKKELSELNKALAKATEGRGSTHIIIGEAGVGKSRIVEEVRKLKDHYKIFYGTAADTIHPFLVLSNAIENELGQALFHQQERVRFEEIFAVNKAGMLMAKASSDEEGMDADIFAGMLSAVQNFVKDSFDSSGVIRGGLGRLEYGDMKILIEHGKSLFLTAVIKGSEHPDMKAKLHKAVKEIEAEYNELISSWNGQMKHIQPIQGAISKLAEARFLVKRDLKGLNLDNERLRIAGKVLDFLKEQPKPLVLILEDLHWADDSSLFVLKYLARNIKDQGIYILGTMRPEMGDYLEDMLKDMRKERTLTELELKCLDNEMVNELIDSQYMPNEFPSEMKEHLAWQCGGNPFFVTEMLRQMVVEGSIERHSGMFRLVKDNYIVPRTVEDMVYRRMEYLEHDSVSIAEYSSCIGCQFNVNVAMSIPSLKEPSYAMEKVKNANIIFQENWDAEFTHAIFREVIYGDIQERWRRIYHKSIGEYYEIAYSGREDLVIYELAKHFSRSGERQKAFDYCKKAAEKAEASFAADQAIQYYDIMLGILAKGGLPNRKEKEIEALLAKGTIQYLSGKWDQAKTTFDKALALSENLKNKRFIARSRYSIGALLIDLSKYTNAFDNAKLANGLFREIEDSEGEANSLWVMGNSHYHKGNYEEALEYFTQSRDIHDSQDNLKGKCNVEGNIGTLFYRKGKLDKAISWFNSMLDIAERIKDQRMISRAVGNQGFAYYSMGDFDKAMECYKRQIKMAERINDRLAICHASNNMGIIHFAQRDYDKAMSYYKKDLEISQELGDRRGTSITLSNIGLILVNLEKYEEAMEYHEKSLSIAEEIGDRQSIARVIGNIGNVYYNTGDFDKAMEMFQRKKEISDELGDQRAICISLGSMGNVHKQLEDYEESEKAYSRAIEIAEEVGLKIYIADHSANKARLMIMLDRVDEAEALAKKAVKLADELSRVDISFRSRISMAVVKAHTENDYGQFYELLDSPQCKREYCAEIYYELFKVSEEPEHREQSLKLYEELAKESSNFIYRKRLEELK